MASKRRRSETATDVYVFEQHDGAFDARAIHTFYEKHGFAAMRLLDESQCADGVYELYENLLMTQPWNDPDWHGGVSPLVLADEHGAIRFERGRTSDAEHRRRVVAALTRPSFNRDELKMLEHHWPLHVGFGAPCDDIGFNLPLVWQARQSQAVYDVVARITGLNGVDTDGLRVDINRPIMRLPKKGEKEFLHWDLDINVPFKRHNQHIQGKVAYTPSRFVCVPGTHTPQYQDEFLAKYGEHKGGNKTALNMDTHAEEFARQQTLSIPAGCYFMWNNQMLHGVTPSASDANIELGFYMGFFPAAGVDRGVHEDRIRSYERGVAPKFWPSGDRIHFYPKRWINFHKNIQNTIDKMPADHPSIKKRKNAAGTDFPELLPWRPTDYVYRPPKLTQLGEMLLGRLPWPSLRSSSDGGRYIAVKSTREPTPGELVGTSRLVSAAPIHGSSDGKDRRYTAVEHIGTSRLVSPFSRSSVLYTDDRLSPKRPWPGA
jgi:hypothetical protein